MFLQGTISLFYTAIMQANDADGMANSIDPDQTAPFVSSDLCVSKYLELLWYLLLITL